MYTLYTDSNSLLFVTCTCTPWQTLESCFDVVGVQELTLNYCDNLLEGFFEMYYRDKKRNDFFRDSKTQTYGITDR